MNRRTLLIALLALAACAPPPVEETGRIIVLRHADREIGDPMLNARGRDRAAALPAALADQQIDAIYARNVTRNLDTAAPLAAARGLTPVPVEVDDGLADFLKAEARGRSIVWIGNSDNLQTLWQAWSPPTTPPVQYGQIAILALEPDGSWALVERRSH